MKIDIDDPLIDQLSFVATAKGQSIPELVSDLLEHALEDEKRSMQAHAEFALLSPEQRFIVESVRVELRRILEGIIGTV